MRQLDRKMSIAEDLTSQDPKVLRKARAKFKGKVTFTYRLDWQTLFRTKEKEFILDDINRFDVVEKHSLLWRNLNEVLSIDESYIYYGMPLEYKRIQKMTRYKHYRDGIL